MKARPRHRRVGMTLVEVVAGLALLGTMVAGLLVAQGRALEQLRAARDRRHAGDLAEELVRGWRLDGRPLIAEEAGDFDGHQGWSWKRTVDQPIAPAPIAVHLEIRRATDQDQPRLLAAYDWLESAPNKRVVRP